MIRVVFVALLSVSLCACATNLREIGKRPHLTDVGSGIATPARRIPVGLTDQKENPRSGSLWTDSGADLFRDPRARRVGDVVTVEISIKDRASLDNSSDRTRAQSRGLDLGLNYTAALPIVTGTGSTSGNLSTDSDSKFQGKGKTTRSENIELELAVVVTDVLPNGNLLISGSQEVRVNYEVRVLRVAGVVRARDISPDNRISYDKIAEARVSYGGRGRIMEVQQPGWGQQALDQVLPF